MILVRIISGPDDITIRSIDLCFRNDHLLYDKYYLLFGKAKKIKPIRSDVEELLMPNGKKVYLLAKGRLANLMLSEGHPAEVMDMPFGFQSLMSEYIVKNKDSLKAGMIDVPEDIDARVGFLKLQSMGIEIDTLTEEQYNYIHGYEEGT